MVRHRVLQVLLVLLGLALLSGLYPLLGALIHWRTTNISAADQMILGIYAPIGVFLLLAARAPGEHRSLILCIGWSNLAHDAVMVVQGIHAGSLRQDWLAFAVIAVVSVALIALLPARQAGGRAVAASA